MTESPRLPQAPIREAAFDQGVRPFVALLLERRRWVRLILSCLGGCEGAWVSALTTLCAGEGDPCDAASAHVGAAIAAAERELGDELPVRLERAIAELRVQVDPPEGDAALARVTNVVAVVQAVLLVEDASQMANLLRGSFSDARGEAVLASLALLGEVAEESVERCWADFDKDQRCAACRMLGRTQGSWGLERLLAALDEADLETRVAAATALCRRRDPAALGELVRSLEEALLEEDPSREEEVLALEEAILAVAAASTQAQSRVIELLASWSIAAEEPVRESFARILAAVDAPGRSDWIEPIVNDPSPAVREIGALATSRLAVPLAIAVRARILDDDAAEVRQALAVALGQTGDPEGFDVLEKLVEDEDARVRAAAFRSLAKRLGAAPRAVESERIISWVDKAAVSGEMCAMSIGEILRALDASQAVPVVRRLLGQLETEALRATISSLSRYADPRLVLELRPALGHPEGAVRVEVAEAFAARGIREVAPAIMKQIEVEDDAISRAALRAAVKLLHG